MQTEKFLIEVSLPVGSDPSDLLERMHDFVVEYAEEISEDSEEISEDVAEDLRNAVSVSVVE